MKPFSIFLLIAVLLAACVPPTPAPANTAPAAPTTTLPAPPVQTTSMPDARSAAEAFLQEWVNEDYAAMYARLSQLSRDAIPQEEFAQMYQDVAQTLSLSELETEVLSALVNPGRAQVAYRAMYRTALVGDLQRDMVMDMQVEDGEWRIDWQEGLIMPDIAGENRLQMDISAPARGNIYDVDGNALAAQSEAYSLGIIPGQILSEDTLLAELARLTGRDTDYLYDLYEFAGDDWYIPVGDVSAAEAGPRLDILQSAGVQVSQFSTRYYFGSTAPHVLGYVTFIGPEELDEYRRLGYAGDEKVGKAGLEKWGEKDLAGQRGAGLYVINGQGQIQARLGERPALPAQSIYTTFEQDFQQQVQKAVEGFRGAAVVLERDTGRVLAMASSPNFNPNLLDPGNPNAQWMGDNLVNEANPMYNRAAQGEYPLGSVFKIITMAAGMESGLFSAESTYECGHTFNEIVGRTYYDWTLEKEQPPSGTLTLPEGLMRSCNPWFYHIGLVMYDNNQIDTLTEMAKGFGLGKATGIGQVAESVGNVPTPQTPESAVELGIGQSELLVTPLQVATFIAAIGNGGTLYRPQVVERIADPDGNNSFEFKPEETGTLPISDETLATIQDAMRSVVAEPRGTARHVFLGINAPVFGKTGTAQTAQGVPHAWFAGYTDAGREDKPDIAVAVIAENSGEGSEIAAPIFRRIIEIYYNGRPAKLYPWETQYYRTQTPTSMYTDTPEPTETPAPSEEPVQSEAPTEAPQP